MIQGLKAWCPNCQILFVYADMRMPLVAVAKQSAACPKCQTRKVCGVMESPDKTPQPAPERRNL